MNGMYRVESDNSVDADEPIMKHMTEGGVTILKQIERKRRVSLFHCIANFHQHMSNVNRGLGCVTIHNDGSKNTKTILIC